MFPSSPNLVRLCTAPNPPSFVGSYPLRWRNAIRSPQPLVPCTLEHTIGRWITSGPAPRTRRSVFGMAYSWLRALAWHILRRVRNVYPELRKCADATRRLFACPASINHQFHAASNSLIPSNFYNFHIQPNNPTANQPTKANPSR